MSTTTPKDEFVKPRKAALYLWTDSLSNLCMLSEVEFSSLDENGNLLPDGQKRERTYPGRVRISEIIDLPPLKRISDDAVIAGMVASLNEEERRVIDELNRKLADIRGRKAQLLAITHQAEPEGEVL